MRKERRYFRQIRADQNTSTRCALVCAAAPGCASETTDDGAAADEAEVSAPGGRYGPALFRNDFYTYLKHDGHHSEEQVRQLVLMPTEDVTPGIPRGCCTLPLHGAHRSGPLHRLRSGRQ